MPRSLAIVTMSAEAEAFARKVHAGARDRYGSPVLDHVARVAAAVPSELRPVAWLHEMLECGSACEGDLDALGLSEGEIAAIRLLTRDPAGDEASYLAHVARLATAGGERGTTAVVVKRADLLDRAAGKTGGGRRPAAPPYSIALDLLATRNVPIAPSPVPA